MIAAVGPRCGSDCAAFVEKWSQWWRDKTRQAPMAMLDCSPGYFERLDGRSRNMVRKARRLYTYGPLDFNEHLAEIDEINTSKPVRQERPMYGWYTQPARPGQASDLCETHRDAWHGAFRCDDGVLVAFAHFVRLGDELGIPISILGHAGASASINGMIAYLAENAEVGWINYLHMRSATPSLEAWKRSVGFQEVSYG